MSLFKYVPPARADILAHCQIRLTPPFEFNDPFEFFPSTDFVEQPFYIDEIADQIASTFAVDIALSGVLNKRGSPMEDAKRLREVKRMVKERQKEESLELKDLALLGLSVADLAWGVACFTRLPPDDPRATLLWGHYADGYRGFVIEFDESHSMIGEFKAERDGALLGADVIYSATRPPLRRDAQATRTLLLTKSESWAYEQEFRLIRPIDTADLLPDNAAKRRRTLLPFSPGLIKGVTFGLKCEQPTKQLVCEILSRPEFSHVRLGQGSYDIEGYCVKVVPSVGGRRL